MTPQEALTLGQALVAAANKALDEGRDTVDLQAVGQSIDDAARAELAAAIARAEGRA